MFYHLKIVIRNLRRNGLYSVINIGGLAVSLVAVILIMLWVREELSYDRFHKNADYIYQVWMKNHDGTFSGTSAAPLAQSAKEQVPGVIDACRYTTGDMFKFFTSGEKKFSENRLAMTDPSFFSIFSFPLIEGNPTDPFPDNSSVVVSRSVAQKFFGNESPVGKILLADGNVPFTVSGVIDDMPGNSSIQCNIIFSCKWMFAGQNGGWSDCRTLTYFQLSPEADIEGITGEIGQMLHSNTDKDDRDYLLQALKQYRLYTPAGEETGMSEIRLFSFIAMIVLIIACINCINLVTARATRRSKEIGLRKVIGSGKASLFGQIMFETVVMVTMAFMISVSLVYIVKPVYEQLAGRELLFNPFHPVTFLLLISLFTITIFLSGIYPAAMLARFKPLAAIHNTGNNIKKTTFRKILIVLQFACSIVFVVIVIVIGLQMKYIRQKNLGYDKENIFVFNMRGMMPAVRNGGYETIKGELMDSPAIVGTSLATGKIADVAGTTNNVYWETKGANDEVNVASIYVSHDFLDIMNIPFVAGRGFTGTRADSACFVINETLASMLDVEDPVGTRFGINGVNGNIVGVVKDFYFRDMHHHIGPFVFIANPQFCWAMYIKTTAKDASAAIAATEKVWQRYNPGYEFDYQFLDEIFDNMYRRDINTGLLFNVFAAIAIFISFLGLFGLVTYTAETKTHEIGIRKVLGASVAGIVEMLSKEFLILVGIAMLIAFPLAYYWLDKMLQDYAYRIDIGWWMFALAGIITVALTLLTVGWTAVKAATANPVKAIKSE